ncbi:hypothetical protein QAD02_014663 [Eretmocerus hayati]|uniref:Uncharacterized protein n=1 Tax=Eretmocerus hayati TaxID=131215 RepID=A0ACC2P624_9HYME|nr:hypothetical protein QAD02_014663 [Eretmocerus hayati]
MAYEDDYDVHFETAEWQTKWSETGSRLEDLKDRRRSHSWSSNPPYRYHHDFLSKYDNLVPDSAEGPRKFSSSILIRESLLNVPQLVTCFKTNQSKRRFGFENLD